MRIPQAEDKTNRIAPQVGGIKPIDPINTDGGIGKAGMQLKDSMLNAMDGFTKLYVADQRADAIKNFNDYNQAVQEYRDSAEIDPTTGQPVGFTQLIGDQVNEGSLQAAQNKVLEARKKLDASMRNYIPDLQNEFGMRADEVQANFDTATNAHFLKSKYEKAKNAADLDNDNIKNNTYFDANDVAKMEATYQSLYNNYYSYYQDSKASEKKAKEDMAKIIENNVNAIMQEGENNSYDKARQYAGSQNIRKALGEEGYRALKHKIDLESTQWQMKLPDMTTEKIQSYIKKHTDHLTPKEKALFIAEVQRNDKTRAGGVGDKSESLWREMVSRLGNAQPDYLMANNEFGINMKDVTPQQSAEFQSRFLVFTKGLMGALNNTPYNERAIRQGGLDAVLPGDEQLKGLRRGSGGELMRIAVNRIDQMLKDGTLPLLTAQQTSAIKTLIDSHIDESNVNLSNEIRQKEMVESELNESVSLLSNNDVSAKAINDSLNRAREYRNLRGTMAVEQGKEAYFATLRKSFDAMRDKMLPAYTKDRNILERGMAAVGRAVGNFRSAYDTSWWNPFKITLDTESKALNREKIETNNKVMAELNDLYYSNGEDQYGRYTIIGFLGKTAFENMWAINNGDGLTLMDLRPDGTPDTMTMQPKSRFAVDWYKPDGIRPTNTKEVIMETAFQFQDAMNTKYNTNQFNDISSIDLKTLPIEDKRYLRELFNRNWLEANGQKGKTMVPIASSTVTYETDIVSPVAMNYGGTGGAFYATNQTHHVTVKDQDIYLSNLNFTLKDVKTKDFIGGVASNEDLVTLLENGYVDGEDYSVQLALNNKDENVQIRPSEIMHDILGSLAPYGNRSKYVDPADGKIKGYYDLMHRIDLSATAALESDKNKQDERLAIQQEELVLLDNILDNLVKDNPGMQKDDFLRSMAVSYDVSDETFKKAVDAYQKMHAKRLGLKRQTYMLVGALAPSKANISYFMKQDMENE